MRSSCTILAGCRLRPLQARPSRRARPRGQVPQYFGTASTGPLPDRNVLGPMQTLRSACQLACLRSERGRSLPMIAIMQSDVTDLCKVI